MSLPKGYLPREGDVLVVHAKVKFDVQPGEDLVHVKVEHNGFAVTLSKVVGIALLKFDVGERVVCKDDASCVGEVVAICDDAVWIRVDERSPWRREHGEFATVRGKNLERCPVPVEPVRVEPPPVDMPLYASGSPSGQPNNEEITF